MSSATRQVNTASAPVELRALQFSMRSADEIVAASAFELTSARLSPGEYGTVADPRGGATRYTRCETCLQTEVHCPGHFGHLRLDTPVLHPLFLSNALAALRVICYRCHRLVFTALRLSYAGLDSVASPRRAERIQVLAEPRGLQCMYCATPLAQYTVDNYNPIPGSNAPKTSHIHRRGGPALSDVDIAAILEDVPAEDAALLGVDPAKFLVRVWPVIPMRCTKQNETGTQVDDLIALLRDMVKLDAAARDPETPPMQRLISQLELKEKLCIYVSNSECRKSSNADRGKPIDGIIDRIRGKRGLIRNNLMGKRSVMTARTVIGPDPTIRVDEVSVARDLARAITVPMSVHAGNLDEARRLVAAREVTRAVRGPTTFNLDLAPDFEPQPGDTLHRRMRDGDWIMMNRQPTLHRGSMIAFKARLRDCKTFGLNLAVTKSFNADFDGDNMNGMVPQSAATAVELAELSSVHNALVIGTRANVCVVQDGLTGVYLMTKELDRVLPRHVAADIVYHMVGDDAGAYMARLEEHRRRLGRRAYDARMVVSLAFPADFSWRAADGSFEVERGLITRGLLSKRWLGANGSSLVKVLTFRYRSRECARFLDRLQFAAIAYLGWRGFSVHADDFAHAGPEVVAAVEKTLRDAEVVARSIKNPRLRDRRVRDVLDTAKDIGMRLVKQATRDSNIAVMIESGSKGDVFNLGQIRGTLGQQTLDGGFVTPQMNGGRRATAHYHVDDADPARLFESRGFISSSFARGLSPREIVFHAMTGREGVCTSATLTAVSGYTARRVNKFCEDMVVRVDGTVGDRVGNVFEFAYGGNGLNPAFEHMDVAHLIERVGGEPAEKRRRLDPAAEVVEIDED